LIVGNRHPGPGWGWRTHRLPPSIAGMLRTLRALRFLFVGPLLLALLAGINLATSPGRWWVQWPALGIGIAWLVCLFRVAKAALVVGGIAALVAILRSGKSGSPPPGPAPR